MMGCSSNYLGMGKGLFMRMEMRTETKKLCALGLLSSTMALMRKGRAAMKTFETECVRLRTKTLDVRTTNGGTRSVAFYIIKLYIPNAKMYLKCFT